MRDFGQADAVDGVCVEAGWWCFRAVETHTRQRPGATPDTGLRTGMGQVFVTAKRTSWRSAGNWRAAISSLLVGRAAALVDHTDRHGETLQRHRRKRMALRRCSRAKGRRVSMVRSTISRGCVMPRAMPRRMLAHGLRIPGRQTSQAAQEGLIVRHGLERLQVLAGCVLGHLRWQTAILVNGQQLRFELQGLQAQRQTAFEQLVGGLVLLRKLVLVDGTQLPLGAQHQNRWRAMDCGAMVFQLVQKPFFPGGLGAKQGSRSCAARKIMVGQRMQARSLQRPWARTMRAGALGTALAQLLPST